jgi:hypothetical protein
MFQVSNILGMVDLHSPHHVSRVFTVKEVLPIFGLTAGRRALRRRALLVPMLLLLEGEEIVNPFEDKQPFEEGQGPGASVEVGPVDEVKDLGLPLMVTAQVSPVGWQAGEGPQLRWVVVRQCDALDGKTDGVGW